MLHRECNSLLREFVMPSLFRDVLLPDRIDPAHREQLADMVEILDQVLHEDSLATQEK
jgi:hypothetical protein